VTAFSQKGLTIALVAGESSGDQLGSRLMDALGAAAGVTVQFVGVGGPLMLSKGLHSAFPMSDIAVNGLFPVLKRLPLLLRRIKQAAEAIAAAKPDVVVLIDAQDFNKQVAKRLRRLIPHTPIIGYVSPTVWAWRPGRARKIKPLFDRLMAVLPFEPQVHARLGGPETVYVGHPLMERPADWTATSEEQVLAENRPYRLLVLPGSRHGEISRLLPVFSDAVVILKARYPDLEVVLPAVEHLVADIRHLTSGWPVQPHILVGETEKWRAFRTARAALAASGTVTLELALAGVPMAVAYRVSWIEGEIARRMITVESASLPNLILGEKVIPEFIELGWTGADLAQEIAALFEGGAARDRQIKGFAEVRRRMATPHVSPSAAAAAIVVAATQLIQDPG
jgi:lipid-A-disaccharide synthase